MTKVLEKTVWDLRLQGYSPSEISETIQEKIETGDAPEGELVPVTELEVNNLVARLLKEQDTDLDSARLDALLTVAWPLAIESGDPEQIGAVVSILSTKRALLQKKPAARNAESLDEVLSRPPAHQLV